MKTLNFGRRAQCKARRDRHTSSTLATAVVVFVAAVAAPSRAFADGVSWDVAAGVAGGSACSNGVDAFIMTNGADVSMVFSNLGVALGGGTPQEGEGACTVQVPASVASGVYPSSVKQTFEYGANRTSGATGTLSTAIRFMGFTVNSVPLTVSASGPAQTASRTDTFDAPSTWAAKWCAVARPANGVLMASFRARATLATPADSIVLFVNGLGLKYEFTTTWRSCGP